MVVEPLYLDSGNTRLKWRYRNEIGVFIDERELLGFIAQYNITQIVLASVTSRYSESALLRLEPDLKVHELQVLDNCFDLKLAYSDISKLGVDRWLNMLGVLEDSANEVQIVVSMGTAMTVDVIDSNKVHLGGYIIPGLTTQAASLNQRAPALPQVSLKSQMGLGTNTAECISHGILRASVALIESLVAQWPDEEVAVTVTGGDGAYLSESLGIQHAFRESLIFDGMRAYWQSRITTLG